ncbi:4Fe-4S dicluster domain-containing protein [Desulfocurvus sp.]|uniref:4Fe-4S binding protein n=1 Tax=Desulfocurvus sp. TaxID=2871698 RepID=UPI0025C5F76E|nr:4Fe-4S dicluster domain-containing protein [Desulfocurvus sp.]MCK9240785.1 4Fe-4S binding protein [Desulfocurvus sp.]
MAAPALAASLLPAALSLWLLGAHALRAGDWGQALAWGLAPLLLALPHGWTRRAAQLALAWAVLVWARAGGELIQMRAALDQPWARLALILGAVMLLAVAGLALLERGPAARRHGADPAPHWPPALALALTVALLAACRATVPFPILLPDRFWPGSGWLLVLALGAYAAWLTRALLAPGGGAGRWGRLRLRAWGLFSALFFAQLLLGLAGAERLLMTGETHLPVPALIAAGPVFRGQGLFMAGLFLATVAVVGPAWCSWLCYIGAWDGAAAARARTPRPLPPWRGPVRAALAALVLLAAWGLRAAGAPVALAGGLAAAFGLAGVALMLAASRRRGLMVHCTAFCPLGLAATLLGRLHPLRVRVGPGCTDCGACLRACRYGALSPERLALGRPGGTCTLCGDCVARCPHAALGYRFPGLSPARSRALFAVLAVSAHAAFLGVARI